MTLAGQRTKAWHFSRAQLDETALAAEPLEIRRRRLQWRAAAVLKRWSKRDPSFLIGLERELEAIALYSVGEFRLFGKREGVE
jgi:hypothetical protein